MSPHASNDQIPTRNGQRQPMPETIIGSPASDELPASDSANNQLAQQQIKLRYYQNFLEDLVAVMRGGESDAVAQLVALIRSGASNDEIHHAIQGVQIEQPASDEH